MPSAARKSYEDLTPLEWQVWYVVTDLDDRRAYPTTRRVCAELPTLRRSSVRGARLRLIGWGLVPLETPRPKRTDPAPRLRVVHPPQSEPFTGDSLTPAELAEIASALCEVRAEKFASGKIENERKQILPTDDETSLDKLSSHSFDNFSPAEACREILRLKRSERPAPKPQPPRSIDDRNALVLKNRRFAMFSLKRCGESDGDRCDERQEAFVGMIRAADNFDPERGAFSTFANRWIANRVKDHRNWSRLPVRVPHAQKWLLAQWNQRLASLSHELGRPPSFEEMCDSLGIPEASRETVRCAVVVDTAETCEADIVAEQPSVLDGVIEREESGFLRDALDSLSASDPMAAKVLTLYYGLSGRPPMIYDEIGRELGFHRSRARIYASRGLARLKVLMKVQGVHE